MTSAVPLLFRQKAGTRVRDIGRSRRSLLTGSVRGSGVIQFRSCLLPCTFRQLSVGGGRIRVSPSMPCILD